MEVLITAGIIEDILMRRKERPLSLKVLSLIRREKIKGWILSSDIPTLHYLHSQRVGEIKAREEIREQLEGFAIVPLGRSLIDNGWRNDLLDFEEALRFEAALQFKLDAIITSDKKHFRQEKLPVYTPKEFLEACKSRSLPSKKVISFIDLKVQLHQIYNEIDDGITDVITNTVFVLGNYVKKLEEKFAEYVKAKDTVAVNNGTSALMLALRGYDVGPGDEVITVPNTFVATAEAISFVGALPVFVDVDAKTYNMNPQKLISFIERRCEFNRKELVDKKTNKKVKAIIPVHLYGQPADMDTILEIASEYGLIVIEDACQAHGSEYKGRKVGAIGQVGAFSFYPAKNLGAYGEGGMVVTNDVEIAKKMRALRDHGSEEKYYHRYKGLNLRMENFQGVVLLSKLAHLDEWNEKRRRNAKLYHKLLAEIKEVVVPYEGNYAKHVYHLYVIRTSLRGDLRKYLEDNGVKTGIHYPIPVHLQRAYNNLGYEEGDFPVSERLSRGALSLPMYPELKEEDIKRVCELIRDYFKGDSFQ